jgi:phosphoribosylformylglycinamidine synthase II
MIYRIDVRTTPAAREGEAGVDPVGEAVRHQIAEFGRTVGPVSTRRIFLIDTDASADDVRSVAGQLLADPVVEQAELVTAAPADNGSSRIEIHLKPGVMDPVAASTEMAIRDMGLPVREVRTGRAYLIEGRVARDELEHIAGRILANGVIESVHFGAFIPTEFHHGRAYEFKLAHVPIRDLSEPQLQKLSREGHLFLSLPEMRAIQDYYRRQEREPTDVELETIAQTWSEHCVHKTLKSAVDVEVRDAAGKVVGTRHYKNLIKETIFDSTMELMGKGKSSEFRVQSSGQPADDAQPVSSPGLNSELQTLNSGFCLSVFKDNAGVVAFDETDAVCFKVETHNHPSAIEPYGGSATGAGGVIRDVLGTGLGAKPIANTDVFCVADPNFGRPDALLPRSSLITHHSSLPRGVIHPRRVLQQVVAGVRDYGNRMGIPTVNGAVYFDDRYLGNPLVFCGCVGLIPRDKIEKAAVRGDAVVVMGGRTGRDGIHGATFSSAELTDTHADEFSHAVQIGNAITEKKVADVLLAARDRGLFTAVTDCGAGGLSSAVGEMGEKIGASVELDTVPLKYAGLRYDEIWISEAQERMVLSVPAGKLDALLELAAQEDVEATVIGTFGTDGDELVLRYRGAEVGRLSMEFLHHGIPMPTRKAIVVERSAPARDTAVPAVPESADPANTAPREPSSTSHGRDARVTGSPRDRLLQLLAHPNIASKHWVVRQYDHEVQGGSVIKPLTGPLQIGPSDAAVIRPKLTSFKGVALGNGLAPHISDPYDMAVAAIDEAIRNVVAVGADPSKVAILDNFCWPSVDSERSMGDLVRTCEACRDAALAYGIPFISGKDSLHNQFTNSETGEVIRIPNTLLISAIAVLDDVRKCVTMDLKQAGNRVVLIEPAGETLDALPAVHRFVSRMIAGGGVASCHDVSEGGSLVAAAEMCIASGLGMDFRDVPWRMLRELNGRYLAEVGPGAVSQLEADATAAGVRLTAVGTVLAEPTLRAELVGGSVEWTVAELTKAWRGALDW